MRLPALSLLATLAVLAACDGPSDPASRRPAEVVPVSGSGQVGRVGETLTQPLVVRVVDRNGRPVLRAPVTFAVRSGQGAVDSANVATDADGVARTRWRLGLVAGDTQRVEARVTVPDVTRPAAEFTAVGTAGAATSIERVSPATAGRGRVGTALPDSLTVRARDSFGNPAPGAAIAWTLAGGGAVSPAGGTTNAAGLASVQWTLGPVSGEQTATASVSATAQATFQARADGALNVSIRRPDPMAPVGDTLHLSVLSYPEASTSGVRVSVRDRSVPLTVAPLREERPGEHYAPGATHWVGKLPLTGLPYDTLTVRAVSYGPGPTDSTVVTTVVQHDPPPVLTVSPRLSGSVADPLLPLKITCTDARPGDVCTVRVRVGNQTVHTGTGSVELTVDVSEGRASTRSNDVAVWATDQRGAVREVRGLVYVETSPRLTRIDSAGTLVLAADETRLLAVDSLGRTSRVILKSRASAAITELDSGTWSTIRAFLTPTGAIFHLAGGTESRVSEWRNGALDTYNGTGLRAADRWATWHQPGALVRRDLVAGTTVTIATNAASGSAFVAPNGDVVYVDAQANVRRYRGGTSTQISAPLPPYGTRNAEPVTDGAAVAYAQGACCPYEPARILWFNGTRTDTVATTTTPSYRVVDGRTAYVARASNGTMQVFIRQLDGTTVQAPFLAGPPGVEFLTPAGDVVVVSDGRRYLIRAPYTQAVDIGTPGPQGVGMIGDDLVVFLGRLVMRVDD